MLNPVVSFFVYFLEMLISYLFFSGVTDRRGKPWKVLLLGTLFFEIASMANLFFRNTGWLNLLIFCLVNLIFSKLCFAIKMRTAVFYTLILAALMTALEVVVIFVLSAFWGKNVTEYNDNLPLLILVIAVNKTLYFLTCLILRNCLVKKDQQLRLPMGLYAYPVGIFICLTLIWYMCVRQPLSGWSQYMLAIVSMILFASTVILFITYQHSLEREYELMLVKSKFQQLQTEKSYYEILEHQNRQLMTYAHDAKNHLAAIKNLNTDARVDRYIEKMSQQLSRYASHCHSGNPALDVMVNKYVTACQLRGLIFEYDVHLCNLSSVEDFDLVAILGNLLDNALASAEQSIEKQIYLATVRRNSYQVIVIENSCDMPPVSDGEHLISTKREKRLHGIGLKNVEKTLKKYRGDYSWDYDDAQRRFAVTVMIGKKRETDK